MKIEMRCRNTDLGQLKDCHPGKSSPVHHKHGFRQAHVGEPIISAWDGFVRATLSANLLSRLCTLPYIPVGQIRTGQAHVGEPTHERVEEQLGADSIGGHLMYLTRQLEIGRLAVQSDSCGDDLSKLVEREFALNPIYSVPLAIDDPWPYNTTADLPSHPQTRHPPPLFVCRVGRILFWVSRIGF